MADVAVRPLRAEDVEPLARVLRGIADEEDPINTPPGAPPDDIVAHFRLALGQDVTALVVDDGGTIVGSGSLRPMGSRREHVATLGMGIAATHRGRGIGSRLLDALLEAARERGFLKVHLTVWATNAAARRLYESRGFATEGVLAGAARIRGRLVDEVVMAKWLAARV